MFKNFDVSIESISPLLMHNGQLADPMNEWTRKLKALSGNRKKTDEIFAEMSRIEWFGSLYAMDDKLIIPSEMIEACLIEGAKKSKLGKQFKSAVFVSDNAVLNIGVKYTIQSLWDAEIYRDVRGVRVGTSRIMRTRPKFMKWSTDFRIDFDPDLVQRHEVMKALNDAGTQVGLGDFRPKFGRFKVV